MMNPSIEKAKTNRKAFVFKIIAVVVSLLVIEIGLQIVRLLINLKQLAIPDKKLSLSIYKDREWASPLFKEYQSIKDLEFEQYSGWRTREYHGQFINIGKNGVRKTFKPSSKSNRKSDSLYVFGGSSIWGTGVRDDYTIPSCLAKTLYQHDYDLVVENYGERGYTFTQNIIRLILLLRKGNRPSVVIFYDGVNEVITAYHNGEAGLIGLATELQVLLERQRQSYVKQIGAIAQDIVVHHSMIYRTVDKLICLLFRHNPSPSAARHYEDQELERLSQDIIAYYIVSLNLVEKLSKTYGFEYICFWQPVIYTKSQLTKEESELDDEVQDQKLRRLYLNTYGVVKKLSLPHFYDLSDILNKRNITFYSDFCHLSEAGNEIVANAIFEKIIKEIPQ